MLLHTELLKKIAAVAVVFVVGLSAALWLTRSGNFARTKNPSALTPVNQLTSQKKVARVFQRPADPQALTAFKNRLAAEGRDAAQHGVYVEALETGEPLAAWNERATFNPASVLKLATSLAALEKLGADYRFRTELRAAGAVDAKTGELDGDLILISGGDPAFSIRDAQGVGDALRQAGVRRVKGALVVVGEFTCNENSQTDISAGVFRRQSRLAFRDHTRYEGKEARSKYDQAKLLLAVESDTLLNILREQNAHSVNAMADMLGGYIGGPAALKEFLVSKVGLEEREVFVMRPSGLDVNRLTPQGTVRVVRALVEWLRSKGYRAEDVMPVAGVDYSTLAGRFTEDEFTGSVIAKTGTLTETDSGAAALAGVASTQKFGPLLFVIYDMAEGRSVEHLRRVQDEFLKDLMREFGGPAPLTARTENSLPPTLASRVVPAQ
jgi:serine-type D-Ala-D-Ala carboxypeptidase/endopeptidase (penicillin-binding protein 4)